MWSAETWLRCGLARSALKTHKPGRALRVVRAEPGLHISHGGSALYVVCLFL